MAFIWDAGNRSQADTEQMLARRLQSLSPDWREVLRQSGLSVWCAGVRPTSSRAYELHDGAGAVLGVLFRRNAALPRNSAANSSTHPGSAVTHPIAAAATGTAARAIVLDSHESKTIIATSGRELITSYWGRYVAFLCDASQNRKWIVKDPTGRLPCFSTKHRDVTLIYSCLTEAVRLGLPRFTVDWRYMAARVATGTGLPDVTALNEVSEIYGGECIEFRSGEQVSRRFYWDPVAIADTDTLEDRASAARALRDTTKDCTHAWAGYYGNILHRLSGGLDSSVVLGCLKDAPSNPRISCVTYHVIGCVSDERPWARMAAQSAPGCEHIEHARDMRINFRDLLRIAPLVAPIASYDFLEPAPTDRRLARERGATAISDGEGGDSLFGSYGTRFAIGDYVRRHGIHARILRIAEDAAMIRNSSVWKVLIDTVRRAVGREIEGMTKERLRTSRKLVCEDAFESAFAHRASYEHPWFQSPHTPPAVPQRLMLATLPELFYNPLGAPEDEDPEPVSPLMSQPVVEVCLRIPVYVHIQGGRDRSLARHAFKPDVPSQVLNRTWKDFVQGYTENILDSNREFLRELLLDGVLVQEKLLDRKALEQNLSGLPTRHAAFPGELVDHMMTEVWLRSWCAGTSQQAAA